MHLSKSRSGADKVLSQLSKGLGTIVAVEVISDGKDTTLWIVDFYAHEQVNVTCGVAQRAY